MPRDLRSLKAHLTVYYWDPAAHRPVDYNNPPASPKFSLTELKTHLADFVKDYLPDGCIHFYDVTNSIAMADYTTLKVSELKKLLQERNLATTGNKPDLIKRLHDADRELEASGSAPAAPGMSISTMFASTHHSSLSHAPLRFLIKPMYV